MLDGQLRGRAQRGAVAGLVGGAAFAATMAIDQRVSGCRADDYRLLADFGPLARWWPVAGRVIHATNSAAVGAAYSIAVDRLYGPGWLRGVTFAMIENTVLWPAMIVFDRVHPAITSGRLPRYNQPVPALLEVIRHVAFGAALGVMYDRLPWRG